MPLFNKKDKQEQQSDDNSENTTKKIGMKQWLKNSGHSLKGVFLEWLSEQPLFDIVNGEIKEVKKDIKRYNKRKKLPPEEKKTLKHKLAQLSDSAIRKFCQTYLDDQAPEEIKENIREGIGGVLASIKSGNFYQKAGSFGDDELDSFLSELDDEWDEDDDEAYGESFISAGEFFFGKKDLHTRNNPDIPELWTDDKQSHWLYDPDGGSWNDTIYVYKDDTTDELPDVVKKSYKAWRSLSDNERLKIAKKVIDLRYKDDVDWDLDSTEIGIVEIWKNGDINFVATDKYDEEIDVYLSLKDLQVKRGESVSRYTASGEFGFSNPFKKKKEKEVRFLNDYAKEIGAVDCTLISSPWKNGKDAYLTSATFQGGASIAYGFRTEGQYKIPSFLIEGVKSGKFAKIMKAKYNTMGKKKLQSDAQKFYDSYISPNIDAIEKDGDRWLEEIDLSGCTTVDSVFNKLSHMYLNEYIVNYNEGDEIVGLGACCVPEVSIKNESTDVKFFSFEFPVSKFKSSSGENFKAMGEFGFSKPPKKDPKQEATEFKKKMEEYAASIGGKLDYYDSDGYWFRFGSIDIRYETDSKNPDDIKIPQWAIDAVNNGTFKKFVKKQYDAKYKKEIQETAKELYTVFIEGPGWDDADVEEAGLDGLDEKGVFNKLSECFLNQLWIYLAEKEPDTFDIRTGYYEEWVYQGEDFVNLKPSDFGYKESGENYIRKGERYMDLEEIMSQTAVGEGLFDAFKSKKSKMTDWTFGHLFNGTTPKDEDEKPLSKDLIKDIKQWISSGKYKEFVESTIKADVEQDVIKELTKAHAKDSDRTKNKEAFEEAMKDFGLYQVGQITLDMTFAEMVNACVEYVTDNWVMKLTARDYPQFYFVVDLGYGKGRDIPIYTKYYDLDLITGKDYRDQPMRENYRAIGEFGLDPSGGTILDAFKTPKARMNDRTFRSFFYGTPKDVNDKPLPKDLINSIKKWIKSGAYEKFRDTTAKASMEKSIRKALTEAHVTDEDRQKDPVAFKAGLSDLGLYRVEVIDSHMSFDEMVKESVDLVIVNWQMNVNIETNKFSFWMNLGYADESDIPVETDEFDLSIITGKATAGESLSAIMGSTSFGRSIVNHRPDLSYKGAVPSSEAFGYGKFDDVKKWLKKFHKDKENQLWYYQETVSVPEIRFNGIPVVYNLFINPSSLTDKELEELKEYRQMRELFKTIKDHVQKPEPFELLTIELFKPEKTNIASYARCRWKDGSTKSLLLNKQPIEPAGEKFDFGKIKTNLGDTAKAIKDLVIRATKKYNPKYVDQVKREAVYDEIQDKLVFTSKMDNKQGTQEYITVATNGKELTNPQKVLVTHLLEKGGKRYKYLYRALSIFAKDSLKDQMMGVITDIHIVVLVIDREGAVEVYFDTTVDGEKVLKMCSAKIAYDVALGMLNNKKVGEKKSGKEQLESLKESYMQNLRLAVLAESTDGFRGPVKMLSDTIVAIKESVEEVVERSKDLTPDCIAGISDVTKRTNETVEKICGVANVLNNSDKALNDKYSSTLSNSILALMTAKDGIYANDMTDTPAHELIADDKALITKVDKLNPTVGNQLKGEYPEIKETLEKAEDDLVYDPHENESDGLVPGGEYTPSSEASFPDTMPAWARTTGGYLQAAGLITGAIGAAVALIALPYNIYKNKKNAKIESEFGSALSVQQPMVTTDDISKDVIGSYAKFIETSTAIEIKQALESSTASADGGNLIKRSKQVLGGTFTKMNKQGRDGKDIKEDTDEILSSFSQSFKPVTDVIAKVHARNGEAFDLIYGIQSLVSSGEAGVFVNDNSHSPRSTIEVEILYKDAKNVLDFNQQVLSKKASVTVDVSPRKLPYEDIVRTFLEMNEKFFSSVKVTPQEKNTDKVIKNNIRLVKSKGTTEEKKVLTSNKFADIINKVEHVRTPLFHVMLSMSAYHDLKERGLDLKNPKTYKTVMGRLPIISIGICDEDSEIISYSTGMYPKYRDVAFKQLESEISRYEKELQSMIKFGMQR